MARVTFVSEITRGTFVGKDPLFSERVQIANAEYRSAITALSHQIRKNPKWAEPWAVLALALSLEGRFDESLTAVEQALALQSEHAFAQELKTGLLLQLGYHEAALVAAEKLALLRPERAESHAFVAFAHAFVGNEAESIEAAERSRSISPNRAIGHQAFCVSHLAFNRFFEAEQHARVALALEEPSASLFHDLGVALQAQGKTEDANRAFAAASELDPRFAEMDRQVPKYRRGPSITGLLSVTLLAGLGLLTVAKSVVAFSLVGLVGVVALVLSIKAAVRRSPTWTEAVVPVLWGLVFATFFFLAQQLGLPVTF